MESITENFKKRKMEENRELFRSQANEYKNKEDQAQSDSRGG
jgi:hypothetical protein